MIEITRPRMLYYANKPDEFGRITHGKFVVEPLERGYGTTLGNALRRVLMQSLPGSAVTSVRISGVVHEFSTLKGVREDVTEIILNIKKLVTRLTSDESKVIATLKKSGPCDVTAADLGEIPGLEIINPELHLASLNKDGKMEMELVIERGRGYVPAEMHPKDEFAYDCIMVDSTFSPVQRVNYLVEDARVGQDINYDKLTIDVYTDGSIDPDEATSFAARFLKEHLSLFIDYMEHQEEELIMVTPQEEESNRVEDTPIKDIEFSVRARNCLKRTDIKSIGELANKSTAELMEIKNFGTKTLTEIRQILHRFSLKLKDERDEHFYEGGE